MHTYYLTHRPPSIGTHPKDGVIEAECFDGLEYRDEIRGYAWGRVTYDRELTEKEIGDFELTKDVPHKSCDELFEEAVELYEEAGRKPTAEVLEIGRTIERLYGVSLQDFARGLKDC